MNRLRMAAALVALAMAACAAPASQAPQLDRQAVEADATAFLQTFWATWAEGGAGYDRGLAMHDDNPGYSMASDGRLWTSLAAVDEAWGPVFQRIDHQTIDMAQTVVSALGPDLAYASQKGTYSQVDTAGVTNGPFSFVATFLLVRTDGVWKVRAYHQSKPNTGARAD